MRTSSNHTAGGPYQDTAHFGAGLVEKGRDTMQAAQTRGLFIGLVLGIVWMWLGFGAALLAAALAIVGWLIGTLIGSLTAGNTTMGDLWNDLQGRRRAGS
jgi:hypothetical protein